MPIISADWLYSGSALVQSNSGILVDDLGRIASIEPQVGSNHFAGAVLMPGLVNAHTHLYSGLAPLGMPRPDRAPRNFVGILEQVWWRLDRALDEHAPQGVDLCLAGVGPQGHFAFNEDPCFRHVEVSEEEFLADRTRLVLVSASTVDMDALVASCGDRAAVPPFAVTLGPHDVLRAHRTEVVFFAGRFQRFALREVLFRKPTMHFPGTLLKLRKQPDGRLVPQNLAVWASPEEAGTVTAQMI